MLEHMIDIYHVGWWWVEEMLGYMTENNKIPEEWCESWWMCEENGEMR